jgi:hypothetical protein
MKTIQRIGIRAAGLTPAAVMPWMILYAAICILWAVEVDPTQQNVALAFAPLWARWHR